MNALIDTSILVYVFDSRFPRKQRLAEYILEQGMIHGTIAIPHQALTELVTVTTRPLAGLDGRSLLTAAEAVREAEELLVQFPILYPDADLVRTALRGAAAYTLSWHDAQIWAYAEHYGLAELISEDFTHDRYYGPVRAVDPFQPVDTIHEPVAPLPKWGP